MLKWLISIIHTVGLRAPVVCLSTFFSQHELHRKDPYSLGCSCNATVLSASAAPMNVSGHAGS